MGRKPVAARSTRLEESPMEWIVAVSPDERARGALLPETERMARAAFLKHGCVLLRGLFPISVVDDMHREYEDRYGALTANQMSDQAMAPPPTRFLEVGGGRFEITLRMAGAFGAPKVFANSLLRGFLEPLLGADMRLSGFTVVVSYPGAALQHVHRDHADLFADPGIGPHLPVYAVNVAVPLIDIDLETGPTGIWPGSHLWPRQPIPSSETVTVCPFQRGDCVLLDYRTFHTGTFNGSQRVRPIVYMVYTRTWFFDEVNHTARTSLDMSLEDFATLPEAVHPLLIRAFSQAMRERWHEVEETALSPE
jgi:hypothetical protein